MRNAVQYRKAEEFLEWYESQEKRIQFLVDGRIQRIVLDGHFGDHKRFEGLIELRWKNGLRVYSHREDQITVIVLLGGTKNGQQKDIDKAKKILEEISRT